MFVKVEPTGCCERKGMVQVRLAMYLDTGDYGYEKHHIQIPVIPEEGYPGLVDEMGRPKDMDDYSRWLDALPKEWQVNPFHNHFIYVEPDVTDGQIMDIAENLLREYYNKWERNEKMDIKNPSIIYPTNVDGERLMAINNILQHLRDTELMRIPKWQP